MEDVRQQEPPQPPLPHTQVLPSLKHLCFPFVAAPPHIHRSSSESILSHSLLKGDDPEEIDKSAHETGLRVQKYVNRPEPVEGTKPFGRVLEVESQNRIRIGDEQHPQRHQDLIRSGNCVKADQEKKETDAECYRMGWGNDRKD